MACLPEDTSKPTEPEVQSAPLAVEGEYYFDGPLFVFTATYHRRRGWCCGSDCRHCPYDEEGRIVQGKGECSPPSPCP